MICFCQKATAKQLFTLFVEQVYSCWKTQTLSKHKVLIPLIPTVCLWDLTNEFSVSFKPSCVKREPRYSMLSITTNSVEQVRGDEQQRPAVCVTVWIWMRWRECEGIGGAEWLAVIQSAKPQLARQPGSELEVCCWGLGCEPYWFRELRHMWRRYVMRISPTFGDEQRRNTIKKLTQLLYHHTCFMWLFSQNITHVYDWFYLQRVCHLVSLWSLIIFVFAFGILIWK